MTGAFNPALQRQRTAAADHAGGERAFQALLACAFLKQHMDLRLAQQQLSRQDRRLRSLADTQNEIRGREMDGVLALLVERTLAITGANGTAIALAEQRGMVCRASCGNAPGVGSTIDPESGFSGLAILSGEILRCDDSQSDPRVDAQVCAELGIRSLVAVPLLRHKSSVAGLLEVFSDQPKAFGDREINVLRLVGGFALEALESGAPTPPEPPPIVATQVIPLPEGPPSEAKVTAEPETQSSEVTASDEHSSAPPYEYGPVEPNILAAPDEEVDAWQEPVWDKVFPLLIAVLFFSAMVAGGLAWRHIAAKRRSPAALSPPEQKINEFVPLGPTLEPTAGLVTEVEAARKEEPIGPAGSLKEISNGALPRVTAIQHWSSGQSSTVVIELEREVPFLWHRLHNPERIYFDVQGSELAPELKDKKMQVSDGIVNRVRIASPQSGVSRVVLDTNGEHEFTTSVSTQPYRVIVEVKK